MRKLLTTFVVAVPGTVLLLMVAGAPTVKYH